MNMKNDTFQKQETVIIFDILVRYLFWNNRFCLIVLILEIRNY